MTGRYAAAAGAGLEVGMVLGEVVASSNGLTAVGDDVSLRVSSTTSNGVTSRKAVIEGENLRVTNEGRFETDASDPAITLVTGTGDVASFRNAAEGRILAAAVAFRGGDGDETVRNRGKIDGAVELGDGDDTFEGRDGVTRDGVLGGAGDDRLSGGDRGEKLRGGGDDDLLRGRGGDDRLNGGAGDDDLRGGSGDDRLVGGSGDDLLDGGAGRDVFVFRPGHGEDAVADFEDDVDRLDLRPFGFANAAEVRGLGEDTADGALLDLTDEGGGTILLADFALADLGASDLIL